MMPKDCVQRDSSLKYREHKTKCIKHIQTLTHTHTHAPAVPENTRAAAPSNPERSGQSDSAEIPQTGRSTGICAD